MRFRTIVAVSSLALTFLAPLAAEAERIPTTHPGPHAAQLTGSPPLRNQDIFEVRFIQINGQEISPREFLWLEPGSYRIQVRILAEHTRPPQRRVGPRRDEPGYNVIELDVEAGKTYHVRGRYNRNNPEKPYSVILHKVE